MMIRASSEGEPLKEEVTMLQAKIARLQQLIAELLMENQKLREATGAGKR
jgi:prefoldin subunit 5